MSGLSGFHMCAAIYDNFCMYMHIIEEKVRNFHDIPRDN